MWEMLSLIIQKTTDGAKSTFGLVEALPIGATEKLESPRLLNSHLKVKYLPKVMSNSLPERNTCSLTLSQISPCFYVCRLQVF